MIIYNEEKVKMANKWKDNEIYILIDFDRTLTNTDSEMSWGVLSKSPLVPSQYKKDREELHNHYRPIELDETLDEKTKRKYMEEWFYKHLNMLIKYKISKQIIDDTAKDLSLMKFRPGMKEFLIDMHNRHIPVIIMSAGIGNFIQEFLKHHNCLFDNIYIVSNFLKFKDGVATGMNDKIIHSLNKSNELLSPKINEVIKDRDKVILFGDTSADPKMSGDIPNEKVLKIGFLAENIDNNLEVYKEVYDVVAVGQTSLDDVAEVVRIVSNKNESNLS